jgi:REP element-mobilizing transposase RayT
MHKHLFSNFLDNFNRNTIIPHHITQRGNRRNDVFFCDNDKNYYLDLLQEYTIKHKVAVLAYFFALIGLFST